MTPARKHTSPTRQRGKPPSLARRAGMRLFARYSPSLFDRHLDDVGQPANRTPKRGRFLPFVRSRGVDGLYLVAAGNEDRVGARERFARPVVLVEAVRRIPAEPFADAHAG